MLTPMMLARMSVVRRPSRKLNKTPHMQPNDRPLKNSAKMLAGTGISAKASNDASERAADPMMNRRRFSGRSSDMNFMPSIFAHT